MTRIEIEERFLISRMTDFRDYSRRTWKLIPRYGKWVQGR